MRASADPVLVKRLSVFASVASVFSVAIGLSGLSGWVFHLLRLTTWGFAPVKMVANTAAGFVLLGGSLWLLRRRTSQPFSRIQNAAAKALAVIAGVLGLLSLAEHLFTVNLGIDQILVRVPATDHAAGVSPGLMSSLTALDFFLLGCAILLLDRRTRRDDWPAQFLCLGAAIPAAFGLAALLLEPGAPPTSMAWPTAVTFSVLISGLLCSRADWAIGGLLTGRSTGARLLRVAAPSALLVLSLIGWLISKPLLTGSQFSWVEASVLGFFSSLALVGFIAWMAFIVERGDAERERAETALSLGKEQLDRLMGRSEQPESERRLRQKVNAAFALALLLTGLLGVLSWHNAQRAAEDADWVAHTHEVSTMLELTLRHLLDVETGGRGFALTADQHFLEPLKTGENAARHDLQALRFLVTHNPAQERRIDVLEEQANGSIEAANKLVALRQRTGTVPTEFQLERGKQFMDATRATVEQMEAEEGRLLEERSRRARTAQHFAVSAIAVGSLLGVVFLSAAGFTVSREIGVSARARAQVNAFNADLEQRVAERTAALGESEGRLAGVIQSAMDAILTVDEQQNIVLFNGAAERMFRCTVAEALGQPITRFIPQRFHAEHAGHIHKFADTGVTNRTMGPKNVLWAARTDGEEFQIEASISQVVTGGKKLFTVILRDVTERVRAEAVREHLASVVDSSDDAIISKDLNGIINAWNRGAEKIFGYSAEEAVGKPMLMLFPNGQGKEEADILARIGRGESVEHFETHRVRKDGQIIDVSVTISPIRDGNGVVVGASKVARDITERIRAQEALRQSDVRRGFALDTAKIGDWDLDLTTLQATRSTLHDQIFGYAEPLPEWNFEIFLRHVHPDDRDRVRETFQSSIRQKKKSEFECRIVWPNGEIRWIWACGDQNRDSSGKATRMFGIVQDITERKRSEEVLRESEERFRLFIEHAPAALAMFDPEMRYLHLSRRWRSDYGLGERDMRGVSHYEVFPEIPARWKEVHRRALAGEVLRHEDDRFDRADGSMKWLRWEVRPWRDGAGAIAGILAFTEDITERKQAQDRLAEQAEELARQAEELAASQKALEAQTAILQSVLGSMGEGLVAVDEQGKFLLWNAAAEKMLGKSAANLVTHEWPERFGLYLADKVTPFPTDKLPVVRALNGEVSASEMFVRNSALPEGAWIEVSGGPRTDSRGVVCGGVVAFRDITERKRANDVLAGQAEELSRQTEQLLRSRNALEAQTRMLELILESVGEGLIAADRNGHFLIWNDAAKKLMGREAIDLPSQQWTTHYKVFLPDGVTAYAADRLPLARAMRGESVRVELMIEHPERAGGVFLEVAARPMRDAEGNLCGGVAVLRDITEQKRAAAALARQAEDLLRSQQALETQTLMLQSVLDSIGEGLVAADETGKFILWNPAATRIVGMGAEDVPPGEWNEHYGVYLPDTVTPFPPEQNPLLRAIRGEVCVAEMYLHNQELESGVWIETSASPLKGKDGVGHGGVIALRDITQRKIDEREIRKLNEELEERVSQRTSQLQAANHELEAFTYSVSHDLRAPLRHIGGFSRILIEDFGPTMDPEARHHLQRIEEGTHRMGLLVDELLNLARVGRHTVSLQVTNLNTLIEEVVSLLQPETEGRAVTWKISSLPLVKCDPVLIKQVFQNLIANALKFTRPRERAIIEISHQEKNGQLVIGVRDNGVGFNMKYSDKLFGVFQRLHRAEEFEGTGIGLATAHRILHKHGERIWAEAEPDKGAAFFFTLAIANATRTAVEAENKNAIVGAQS